MELQPPSHEWPSGKLTVVDLASVLGVKAQTMEAWTDSQLLRAAVGKFKSWRTRFNKISAPPIRELCLVESPQQNSEDSPTNAYIQLCSEYARQCADLLGISEDQSITSDHIQTMSQVIQVASRRSKPSTGWHNNAPGKSRFSRVPKTPHSTGKLLGAKNQETSQQPPPVRRSTALGLRQSRTIELSTPTRKPSLGPQRNSGAQIPHGSRDSNPSEGKTIQDKRRPKQLPKGTSTAPKTSDRPSVTAPSQYASHKKQAVRPQKAEDGTGVEPPMMENTGGVYRIAKNTKVFGGSPALRGGNIFAPAKSRVQTPSIGAWSDSAPEGTAPKSDTLKQVVPQASPPSQSGRHSGGSSPPECKSKQLAGKGQGSVHTWVRDTDGNILRRPGPDGIDVRLSDFVEPEVGLDTAEKRGFGPIRVPVVWKDAPLPRSLRSGLTLSHDVLIPSWMSLVSRLCVFSFSERVSNTHNSKSSKGR